MNRREHGLLVAGGILFAIAAILAAATAWGTKPDPCALVLPNLIGCALAQYESLSGGLIAAGGALFGGWLAWSAVREQVEVEKRKIRAADVAEQSKIADGISRDLSELSAAQIEGRALLVRLNELLKDPSPYATRFVDLWAARSFPIAPGIWSPAVIGDRVWNLVMRLKSLAESITEEIRQNNALNRNGVLMSREAAASDLVAEFHSTLEGLTPLIRGRQEALTEANEGLAKLKRNL